MPLWRFCMKGITLKPVRADQAMVAPNGAFTGHQ